MAPAVLFLCFLLVWFAPAFASEGDADPVYRSCVEKCEQTGCVEEKCFKACKIPVGGQTIEAIWFMQEPLYSQWKEWDCRTDCRYQCMVQRERERKSLGQPPLKYHGRWPLKRVFGLQEPVSVALSVMNLALQFHGWLSFLILLYYKLPLNPVTKGTYYDFTKLAVMFGVFAMNSCLWNAFFHSRDVELTERLDCSSSVALVGFSLIFAILRTFNVRNEVASVMVAAPLIAFVTTHILYLNFYDLNDDLNMTVCVAMIVIQLMLWFVWAIMTCHPSRTKVWIIAACVVISLLLEFYDFPPFWGYVDADTLCHGITIPLTYFWWSFIKEDAEYRTKEVMNRFTPAKSIKTQ